jgi:hypothetical protein
MTSEAAASLVMTKCTLPIADPNREAPQLQIANYRCQIAVRELEYVI